MPVRPNKWLYARALTAALCYVGGVAGGCATPDSGGDANANQNGGGGSPLARFDDPDSAYSTEVVRDIDGETFSFDTNERQLIWLADGRTFDGWRVQDDSLFIGLSEFRVRFGTEDGVRQAYFTEVDPPTICDLVADGANLGIFPTTVLVPQE